MSSTHLTVAGLCAAGELLLDHAACSALPEEHRIPDVGTVLPGRQGSAIRFRAIAEKAQPDPTVRYVHVASTDGGFTASLDFDEVCEKGVVLYGLDDQPLPETYGGPFRLMLVDSEDCSVNVKFLGRVEFTAEPGSHTAKCADEG